MDWRPVWGVFSSFVLCELEIDSEPETEPCNTTVLLDSTGPCVRASVRGKYKDEMEECFTDDRAKL